MAPEVAPSSAAEPPRKIGAFGVLGALGDPEVQQMVGLGVSLSKHLSREMAGGTALENK